MLVPVNYAQHSGRLLALCATLSLLTACHGKLPGPPSISTANRPLEIVELSPGAGQPIGSGQVAVVDYTGWLFDPATAGHKGQVFDSSRASGAPFRFRLGAGDVIKGWDQGVLGMKAHGRRQLTIPPELAYGDRGAGRVIPPGATLVFDVELVSIE
jgi:FKBP-type peptidyl-prolyl cis-trans isomerase FkpA